MKSAYALRPRLFEILDRISEYHPDLTPRRRDSMDTLWEKYFYWVDEYNDGYDPNQFERPSFI